MKIHSFRRKMVWKNAIKIVIAASEALSRAFTRAVREELRGKHYDMLLNKNFSLIILKMIAKTEGTIYIFHDI